MSASLERYSHPFIAKLVLGSSLIFIGACRGNKPAGPTSRPMAQEDWKETALAVPEDARIARPVRAGKLPLVYLVETPTTVRIVDKTNSSEMLLLPVQGKTTISLTESGGLRVGGTPMRFANLPGDHEYEIYLQNSVANPNVFRTGTVRPGQAPASPAPGAVTPPSDVPSQPLLPNTGTVTGGTP